MPNSRTKRGRSAVVPSTFTPLITAARLKGSSSTKPRIARFVSPRPWISRTAITPARPAPISSTAGRCPLPSRAGGGGLPERSAPRNRFLQKPRDPLGVRGSIPVSAGPGQRGGARLAGSPRAPPAGAWQEAKSSCVVAPPDPLRLGPGLQSAPGDGKAPPGTERVMGAYTEYLDRQMSFEELSAER